MGSCTSSYLRRVWTPLLLISSLRVLARGHHAVYVIVTAPFFFPLLVPAGRSSIIENGAKLSSILSAYSQDVSEIFRQIISKSGIYLYLVLFIIENEANMFLFKYACMRTMYMHKIFFR
jgi:hypothetical protein